MVGRRPLVEVLDDVGITVRAAQREVRARPVKVEAEAGVLMKDAAAAGVDKCLGKFPEFAAQDIEAVTGEVEHFPVKHARIGVLFRQALLEFLIRLRQLALGSGLARLRLCQQFGAAGLVLFLCFARTLLGTRML